MDRKQGTLRVTAPYDITNLRVLDPSYREVATGTYQLEVLLDPGIYRVQAIVPGSQDEKLVSVWPGETKTLSKEDFNLAVSLPVSLNALEPKAVEEETHIIPFSQSELELEDELEAEQQKEQAHVSLGKERTSRLTILAQSKDTVPFEVPCFTLRSRDGEVSFPQFGEYDLKQGWLSLRVDLPAGIYVLEHEVPDLGKRGQIIFVEKGWETQVLVPWDNALNFANATLLMRPLNASFAQDSLTLAYEKIEAALMGLAKGQLVMTPDDRRSFLAAELDDPMLELIGCYVLLAQSKPDYCQLQKIADHLLSRLTHSPDAQLIALFAQQEGNLSSEQLAIAPPPLFTDGVYLLEKILGKTQNPFLAEILSQLTIGSVWTRWADPSPNGLLTDLTPILENIDEPVKRKETPRFIELGQVQAVRSEPEIKFCINQGVSVQREQTKTFKLSSLADKVAMGYIICATYRQIFERDLEHYLVQTEFTELENKLSNGEMTLKAFIESLGNSNLYIKKFYAPYPNTKVIELGTKHFLGRAPLNQQEIQKYNQILATQGIRGFIRAMVNSMEYLQLFGEDTVPYRRFSTLSSANFVNTEKLYNRPLDVKSEPKIKFWVYQGLNVQRGQDRFFKLTSLADKAEVKNVIRAAYRQIFERDLEPYAIQSEFMLLEEKLSNGEIMVKEFIEGLGSSDLYLKEFYSPYPNTKVIELGTKHFLGRAPLKQQEIQKYNQILATQGIRGFIRSMVNSMEYLQLFGEDIVPYHRFPTLPDPNSPNTEKLYNKLTQQDTDIVVPSFRPIRIY